MVQLGFNLPSLNSSMEELLARYLDDSMNLRLRADGYQSEAILSEELTVAPLAFPECVIAVREMLRSP